MSRFYAPDKTFVELIRDYSGDKSQAYEEFEEAWDNSKDTRSLDEAMGVSEDEIVALDLGEISLDSLLSKYKAKTAASLGG